MISSLEKEVHAAIIRTVNDIESPKKTSARGNHMTINAPVNFQGHDISVGVLRVFPPGGLLRGGVVPPPPWDLGFCFVAGAEILTTSSGP